MNNNLIQGFLYIDRNLSISKIMKVNNKEHQL